MKALRKTEMGAGHVEVQDVPEPTPGPGQVKIKVMRAGLCGSDVHEIHGYAAIKLNVPVTMGHECIGQIVELGEGVTGYEVGQKVTSEVGFHVCGTCDFCVEGYYNICIERQAMGYFHNGVFAEYVVVPARNLVAVPDSVDWVSGALIEPLACVCHMCYDMTRIESGDLVLVTGPGPIGIMAMQVAKSFGATVIVTGIDQDANRLAKAKELGADYVFNVDREDPRPTVDELSGGYGVDVVLECSGSEDAINQGLALCKKRGQFCQFGLGDAVISFNIEAVVYKEITITASMASRKANWRKAAQLIERGVVNAKAVAADGYALNDWQRAVEVFDGKQSFKLLFDPSLA
ncbi:zinc-dependent alcohol dehydrogenase [Eggerthella sinensis]|uniref:zinc-dependent alcohol dehydrogenase n=1 Tax=Eggerthella sinensis TaxID=242230 RepID=UPI00266CCE0E|nr:zinc-binding dehydrogenase [Eggerthella sinensis]